MVQQTHDDGDVDGSVKPRLKTPRSTASSSQAAEFRGQFLKFLRYPETPFFDCPKKAIKGWRMGRLQYLREHAASQKLSKDDREELVENDELLGLLRDKSFLGELHRLFEEFVSASRSRKKR